MDTLLFWGYGVSAACQVARFLSQLCSEVIRNLSPECLPRILLIGVNQNLCSFSFYLHLSLFYLCFIYCLLSLGLQGTLSTRGEDVWCAGRDMVF